MCKPVLLGVGEEGTVSILMLYKQAPPPEFQVKNLLDPGLRVLG